MSSLYLHIPYCQQKCDYCDFFSVPLHTDDELQGYVELLLRELTLLAARYPRQGPLQTIFFGGGTPSLLSADQVGAILCRIKDGFGIASECEISLEANPGTVDLAKLQGYRRAGVNRISLGVQSLADDQLRGLGRIHDAVQARQAVFFARQAGFDNLSLDLIFALPGQGFDRLANDVAGLLALQPQHLSLYGLSFEPGTPLGEQLSAGKVKEADERFYADSYRLIDQKLQAAGFEHYEISNFARPGFRCRHNQVYWQRRTCLAAGCGAHSFVADGWGERWSVPAFLAGYRDKLKAGQLPMVLLEGFDRQSAMAEYIYLALRTADGLSRVEFKRLFGVFPEDEFDAAFRRNAERLSLHGGRWRFDVEGWLLYDHLISSFL